MLQGQVVYHDADPSNTTLADGSPLVDGSVGYSTAAPAANNLWSIRSFGNGNTVFESNGRGSEDAPRLRTVIPNLEPGEPYDLYVYFWGIGSLNMRGRAGEDGEVESLPGHNARHSSRSSFAPMTAVTWNSTQGANPILYPTPSQVVHGTRGASSYTKHTDPQGLNPHFTSAVLVEQSSSALYQVALPTIYADENGEIAVYIDDLAHTNHVNRTRYDGVGVIHGDFDGDGMLDHWERTHGLDVTLDDGADDLDGDGLSNVLEFEAGTDPKVRDSDGDGQSDLVEVTLESDPLSAASQARDIVTATEFNLLPWRDALPHTRVTRASGAALVPSGGDYALVDTSKSGSGAILSFQNPNQVTTYLIDFRIEGTMDARVNFAVGNNPWVRTGSYMQCVVLVFPDGSVRYYEENNLILGAPAGSVVPGASYSLKMVHDVANDLYQIELIDQSHGGVAIPVAPGVELATRNQSPKGKLYLTAGIQNAGAGEMELHLDNMAVVLGDEAAVGSSRALLDSDADGGSDVWELEQLHTLDHLGRAEDSDGDVMDQAWEITHFGHENQGALDNPDGDLAPNWWEYLTGTDPMVVDSNQGFWQLERFYDLPFYSVPELVSSARFFGEPDQTRVLQKSGAELGAKYAGSRMRGYLEVPEDGAYRFWVSCRASANLLLSSDETPFYKRRIAFLGADAGTGHGIRSDSDNWWDVFSSQLSEPIDLVAGQKYYLEVIHQNGHGSRAHVHVAWAREQGTRTLIPRESMSSFIPLPEDADDDSLPDAWETQYGLNPTDNGFTDLTREGEYGDFDQDGLTNHFEFLLGTNPANADSDGDGITDGDEVNGYLTDPTQSDAPSEELVSDVDLGTFFSNTNLHWTLTDSGLIPEFFRGQISWNFTTSQPGHWILQLRGELLGTSYYHESMPLTAAINGTSIGTKEVIFGGNQQGLLRLLTPSLPAGTHTLTLDIENVLARRSLMIKNFQIFRPTGTDADQSGTADWAEALLANENTLLTTATTSRTSPACVEGVSRSRSATLITDAAGSHSVAAGLDGNHWFHNLPLAVEGSTPFTVSFAADRQESSELTWSATNLFDGESLLIRQGDQLKLLAEHASLVSGDPVTVTLSHQDHWDPETLSPTDPALVTTLTLSAGLAQPYLFDTVGKHYLQATLPDGTGTLLTVETKQAAFTSDVIDLLSNTTGFLEIENPAVDSTLTFDAGLSVGLHGLHEVTDTGFQLQATPTARGPVNLLARLHQNGPILGVKPLNLVLLTDALQNDLTTGYPSSEFPGFSIVTAPIVVTDLPPGATVVVRIYRAGVTFLDGTKTRTLHSGDFVNGTTNLQFLFPIGLSGGYCHHLDIYDRNGAFLGRR